MFPFRHIKQLRASMHQEFTSIVDPLLSHELVRRLDNCKQHMNYTRLRHSLDVAHLSFYLTRLLGWNWRETTRAALLHDLFFHSEGQGAASLMRSHPEIAIGNARTIVDLTHREEDIIRRHMWLLTLRPPRYKEGYVVTFVDKFCATREFVVSVFTRHTPRTAFGKTIKKQLTAA